MYIKELFFKIDLYLLHLLLGISVLLNVAWFMDSLLFIWLQSLILVYQLISTFSHLLLKSHDERIDRLRSFHCLFLLVYLALLYAIHLLLPIQGSMDLLNYFITLLIPQTIFFLYWFLTYREYHSSKIYLQKHRIFF